MMMNKNKFSELVRYQHPLNFEFSFDLNIEKIHTKNTNSERFTEKREKTLSV